MHQALSLRSDKLMSGQPFPKEKLISRLLRKARKWGISPSLHTNVELLPSLAIDLCNLYARLYDQARTANLESKPAFLLLEKPTDPRSLIISDSHKLRESIERHFKMIVSLYETLLVHAKDSVSYLSWGLYEAYMAMSAMYLRDLNPYFAYEAYEVYEPGSVFFIQNYHLADSDLRKSLQEISRMALVGYQYQPAPIVISYRDSAFGKGALFDHRTLQQITKRPTLIGLPPDIKLDEFYKGDFYKKVSALSCEITDDPARIPSGAFYLPPIATKDEMYSGLFVVTGRAPVNSNSAHKRQVARNAYERPLIRHAYNTRQPYLGICGGMWQTLAALKNIPVDIYDGSEAGLFDTESHRGCMPDLDELRLGKVINNRIQHSLNLVSGSVLTSLMRLSVGSPIVACNSVHWQSVKESELPTDIVKVAARSTGGKAEHGVVEALASRYDAPQVVVQWHPEAFSGDNRPLATPHKELISNLATTEADVFYRHYQRQQELRLSGQDYLNTSHKEASDRISSVISGLPKLFE